jgi:hypothetical protein
MGKAEQTATKVSPQVAASDASAIAEVDGRLVQTEKGLAVATGTDVYVVAVGTCRI